MSIEANFYATLSGSTAVTSVVSSRIYPVLLPQSPTYPAVTYSRTNGNKLNTLDGFISHENPHLIVDVYGTTYKGVKDLAITIHKAVNASTSLKAILIYDEDNLDIYDDGEEIYRVTQDYSCWGATT